jgi:hypothetical protein
MTDLNEQESIFANIELKDDVKFEFTESALTNGDETRLAGDFTIGMNR